MRGFLIVVLFFILKSSAQLQVGFYEDKCPKAESTIHSIIVKSIAEDQRNAAVLLRLQFHDCFVQGCDGSILLRHDGDEASSPGNAGVEGFSIIEEAKAEVERLCPGVVSCADIVAVAARDAVFLSTGGLFFDIPTGRLDGRVSKAEEAANLPEPDDTMETLRSKFREQGLNDKDLVLLSAGAHTIGRAACFFVNQRLEAQDQTMNAEFSKLLRTRCPQSGDVGVKVPLDWDGEFTFDDHIFQNIRSGKAVISSDSVLYQDESTRGIIDSVLANNNTFTADFAVAMVKMGRLKVKAGDEGEIRRRCDVIN